MTIPRTLDISWSTAATTISSKLTTKRVLDVDNDPAPAQHVANKARANEEHPTHPLYILEHLIREVLSAKCHYEKALTFYQEQPDNPAQTIKERKGLLPAWILQL